MDLAARFRAIIDGFCKAVAVRGAARNLAPDTRALLLLLWTRLRRAAARFAILAAGAPPPRPRAPKPRPARPRAPDLPRRRGWVLAPIPEAAGIAGRLRALLEDPATIALIGTDPRFGRLLRPLCRTLGLRPPPCLRRNRAPRAAPAFGPRWPRQTTRPTASNAPPRSGSPAPRRPVPDPAAPPRRAARPPSPDARMPAPARRSDDIAATLRYGSAHNTFQGSRAFS